jgi:hypothetical protein
VSRERTAFVIAVESLRVGKELAITRPGRLANPGEVDLDEVEEEVIAGVVSIAATAVR